MRIDLRRLDLLVAAAATAGLGLEAWLDPAAADHHQVLVPLLWAPITLAVAVRRSRPELAAATAIVLAIVGQTLLPAQLMSGAIGWMCDLYALAVWTGPRAFRRLLALYLGGVAVSLPFSPNLSGGVFFTIVSTIAIVLVRVVVGDRERRARLAERERDIAAREAVVEERARIARELHDAIAHNVSMMVVRYGRDSLELEITDDGRETPEPVASGGHGLVGMRERVALYGGSLEAGRRVAGGFTVRVLLPIR